MNGMRVGRTNLLSFQKSSNKDLKNFTAINWITMTQIKIKRTFISTLCGQYDSADSTNFYVFSFPLYASNPYIYVTPFFCTLIKMEKKKKSHCQKSSEQPKQHFQTVYPTCFILEIYSLWYARTCYVTTMTK